MNIVEPVGRIGWLLISASQLRSAPRFSRNGAERALDLPERSGIFAPETAPLQERNDRSGVMYLAWDCFATPAPQSLGAEQSALRGSRSGAVFSLRSALRSGARSYEALLLMCASMYD